MVTEVAGCCAERCWRGRGGLVEIVEGRKRAEFWKEGARRSKKGRGSKRRSRTAGDVRVGDGRCVSVGVVCENDWMGGRSRKEELTKSCVEVVVGRLLKRVNEGGGLCERRR
jgi:hypothetical protein